MTPKKFAASICLAASIFLAGYMANRPPAPAASSAVPRQALYYTCPMHPSYKSDRPGDAPCCGMRLVAVYAGESAKTASETDLPGTVQVATGRQQLIGIRTSEVRRQSAANALRVAGRLAADEDRLHRIVAAADGWIRGLGQNTPGTAIQKDQLLASYYTANLLAATQTLSYASTTNDQAAQGQGYNIGQQRGPTTLSLQVAVDSLRSLGMSERQIEEVQRTRQAASLIHIYAPISGVVLTRGISPGQRFDKGSELYRIADIRHLWVLTDIFEKDREFVKPGSVATVRYRGRELPARMSNVLPQFDPQSRTFKTRFELDNPNLDLRPDMFVDVEIGMNLPSTITVPADAVIDTGRRKMVYVDRGNGYFEPRSVSTGWRLGDQVQVTGGLEPGERIVTSGNFLIDSESRMRAAAVTAAAPPVAESAAAKDPVCGMDVDPKAANAIQSSYAGKTYTFCSPKCKKDFDAAPSKYVETKQTAANGPTPSHP